MDEHVFATIIALDETETLHVVEEFDRAISALTGQLALGCTAITAAEAATITAISAAEAAAITAAKTATVAAIKATAALGARGAFRHRKRIALDNEVSRGNFATAINEREFERLALCQTGQASLLDRADMHENVIGLLIALNEAKALLTIEEFDDALARPDNLRGH